jgi:DNA-binding transcriptional MerR regulator
VGPKNTFFANDWFDSNFLDKFVYSDSKIKHQLNKQTQKIGENQISSRVLNHWYEKGIIIDDRPENKGWKKFSFSDAVWVTIVIKLRKFGLNLEQIKLVKEQLDYYNKLDKVSKCSLLDFYLVVAMTSKIPIKLVVFESGQAELVRQIDLDLANTIDSIPEDFISIDINKLVGKMLKKQGVSADYLGYSDIPMSPIVKEIEKSLSAEDIQSVTVNVKDKGRYVVEKTVLMKNMSVALAARNLMKHGILEETVFGGKTSKVKLTTTKHIKK